MLELRIVKNYCTHSPLPFSYLGNQILITWIVLALLLPSGCNDCFLGCKVDYTLQSFAKKTTLHQYFSHTGDSDFVAGINWLTNSLVEDEGSLSNIVSLTRSMQPC